jgi:hypothetical protein
VCKTVEKIILRLLRDGQAVSYNNHTIEMDKYKYVVDGKSTFGKHCLGWYSLVNYIES